MFVLQGSLKARSALRISVTGTFSLGVTVEALWAKIDRKSAFRKPVAQYGPNFTQKGTSPHQSFLHG